MKKLAFLTAVLAITAAGMAHAEERRITVDAAGTVQAAPDMATITLGVTNEDPQASAAMQATSEAVTQILTRLDDMGVEARDVQTRDLSLSPVWTGRNSSGDRPEISGFVASNSVLVRVRDLTQLGTIMDAVIQDGANDFGGLNFGVQDPAPLQAEARAKAVGEATAKAEQLAQAANVTLGPVQQISEQVGGSFPVAQMRAVNMSEAGSVPVAGGEISVSVNVTMEFGISD
ncbi:SIMPL domain-containing protein [Ruegeria meonggei]|uniref:26 kDa periplasmic immunogenic protein n=1 Tax=Ruegeria meonggei TaxID=1446476 RepID=A0A1X6YRH2_9RHOB|nr:SIMPL domain-containing protein [Ruegeria meonggei]SLN28933.1 26 kDa periplasmic immunogenic protein precursor [Ruegeria meonggei]